MNKSERLKASKHEDGVDFISRLSDPILLLILSGLPSTKEVIRTSIFSRRWRTVDLDSFRLYFTDSYSMSTIKRWIHAAVMRNVKRLEFKFWPKEKDTDMVMPHCLVTCASLEELRLCLPGYRLILPSFSGFPVLRVLSLESVELFDEDLVTNFLESCPLLEDLTFEECTLDKLDLLCISCPKLKKLKFDNWGNRDLCGCVKLSCPKLVFLKLNGEVASNFIFEYPYSLKKAVISPEGNIMHRLLPGISDVESLDTDMVLLCECMEAAGDPTLPNLKILELSTISNPYTFTAETLIKIIKYCPKLESLRLTVEEFYSYYPMDSFGVESPQLDEAETGRILTPDVKWVEFFEINGEKPNLVISWSGDKWIYVNARWGN